MRPDLGPDRIEAALRAHRPRRFPIPGLRRAAVLVPLFRAEPGGETRLWLLRRPDDGTPHGGQVALPGGKREPGERMSETALREAREELGIAAGQVSLLGELDELVTITGFRVTPWAGWLRGPFEPVARPREVARAFSAPLATFAGEPERHTVKVAGFPRRVDSMRVDAELVWGATYAILRRFVALLG